MKLYTTFRYVSEFIDFLYARELNPLFIPCKYSQQVSVSRGCSYLLHLFNPVWNGVVTVLLCLQKSGDYFLGILSLMHDVPTVFVSYLTTESYIQTDEAL